MPWNPSKIQVAIEKRCVKMSLPTGKLQDRLRLPLAKSQKQRYISFFLAQLCLFSMLGGSLMVTQYSGLRAIRHTNDHGLTSYTTMALGCYAISLRERNKDEKAYEYGDF